MTWHEIMWDYDSEYDMPEREEDAWLDESDSVDDAGENTVDSGEALPAPASSATIEEDV